MNATLFLATTGDGIARAERGPGDQWTVSRLLADQDVRCIAADPRDPTIVYAGTQGSGVLRSDDRGQTWRPAGMEGQVVKSVAPSPVESGVVYAGTKPAYVFVSRDAGATWTEFEAFRHVPGRKLWFSPAETPFIAYAQGIALSPTDPDCIVVGIEAGAVLRSTDGGQTWSTHRAGAVRDCHSITFHHTDGSRVYEAGGTGAAYSLDAGDTWDQPKDSKDFDRHYCWAVAAHPTQPAVWYISASPSPQKAHGSGDAQAYIYRRDASGWTRLGGGLPQPLDFMPYTLLTDPTAPDHVYAGLSNGDVWHSPDRGATWSRLPVSLPAIHRTLIML